jgi:hypothetical protein
MSRLRVIAHLESNGSSDMAREIAGTVQSPKAQQVAKLLLKPGTTGDAKSKKLAAKLLESSKPGRRTTASPVARRGAA